MIQGEDERNGRVDVQMSHLLVSGGGLFIARYWYNHQRVLNYLWKTRLSRCRMIWHQTLRPFLARISSTGATHRKIEQERQLADGRWGEMGGDGGRRATSDDGEIAWFSINHSLLSRYNCTKYVHCDGAIADGRSPEFSTKFFSISKKSTKLCGKIGGKVER
jgi:hypothetical protein